MSKILRDIPVEKQINRSMRHWEARRAERQRGAAGRVFALGVDVILRDLFPEPRGALQLGDLGGQLGLLLGEVVGATGLQRFQLGIGGFFPEADISGVATQVEAVLIGIIDSAAAG